MNSTKSAVWIALIATVAPFGAACAAAAGPSAEQMAHCAAITARDERLSCYDVLAHRPPDEAPAIADTAAAPATPAAPVAASSARAPKTVAAVAADPKNFGLTATQEHIADLGPSSQTSHISILSSDQTGKTYAVLDNDQTWIVTDPDGWLHSGDAVTIRRAQFGSYLLFTPSNHSYHVRRLK
ncbi:MAG TPA: hypothetical protein VN815_01420 [Steroidobacteraceae bacterium]|nr:hypothetical protein [Steroidobacteraceae bacterium]